MVKKKKVQTYIASPIIATTVLFSPVFAGSVSADTIHTTGDSGSNINSLQSDLSGKGFDTDVDGIFGPKTKKAVQDYQKSKGLQVDGIAGKNTLSELDGKSSSSNDSGSSLYRVGDNSSKVSDLQSNLETHGYNIATDGIFGSNTKDAIQSFQKKQGLQVDGIAGKKTLSALKDKDPDDEKDNRDSGASSDGTISTAQDLVGTPYVFGGTTTSGFDSSGFINYVFDQEGVDLNRTHAAMWENDGKKVDNPSPGDVVFFEGTYKSGVSHSGIYLGDNEMVHAGTEDTGVEVTNMDIGYWSDKYIGAKSMQ